MSKLAIGFLVLTLLSATFQAVWWYPQLPDNVPTHFDFAGQPDGWSTPFQMCAMFVGLQLAFTGSMALLAFAIKSIPDSMINIPNRDYWLAPERRRATLYKSRSVLVWVAIISGWLFIAIFHLSALLAIKKRTSINPEFWVLIVIYMVMVFGICGRMVYNFRLPRDSDARS